MLQIIMVLALIFLIVIGIKILLMKDKKKD